MPQPKFRVAICGGGIGGLCLAVALSRYRDIRVDLYEAAEQFREIGAGVMIWSKTWAILQSMGLADDFSRIAQAPPSPSKGVAFDYRRSDQPGEGFRFHSVEVPHGCICFHRAQFLEVFVNHLPNDIAHFGKKLVAYTTIANGADSIALHFADGSSSICDVLIGCDGIKSEIRKQMFNDMAYNGHPEYLQYIDPVWSGTVAYRGLIPAEALRRANSQVHRTIETPMMYCGKSKHIVSYSISHRSVVNVVAFVSQPEKEGKQYDGPWVIDCSRQELLECFSGWESEVQDLLKSIDKPTKWAIHQLKPLPAYVNGRVALLGDAAHAMVPHQGAGSGQAIEDAYMLANILGSTLATQTTLPLALKAYEHVRLPMASHVLEGSRMSGLMYEFNGPNANNYSQLGPAIQRQWDWVWNNHPDHDVLHGIEWLKNQVSAY